MQATENNFFKVKIKHFIYSSLGGQVWIVEQKNNGNGNVNKLELNGKVIIIAMFGLKK